MTTETQAHRKPSKGLLYIAAFKLLKAMLLLAVGIGALRLLHRDIAAEVMQWVNLFRVDPDNNFLHRVLDRLSILDEHRLRQLSIGTFFYSGLLFTEGIGLALRKRWAEYFTIIVTSSFIPLEVWEMVREISLAKVVVFLTNVAIVVYLVFELRRHPSQQ